MTADYPHPFETPQASSAPLTLKTRTSSLALSRFQTGGSQDGVRVGVAAEEAFYAIFQLREHPPHEFWSGERGEMTPLAPRGALHIVDLRTPRSALMRSATDSFNIHLPLAALDDLAEELGAPRVLELAAPEPWRTPDPFVESLQPALLTALARNADDGPMFADALLRTVVTYIAETYGGLAKVVARVGGLAPWQERRARELIESDLAGALAVSDVAAECRLSPWHFSRAFKASTGHTPHGWLQSCRTDRARALLTRRDATLAEVAAICGFSDQSHLTRVFRQVTGTTPGAWQRQELARAS